MKESRLFRYIRLLQPETRLWAREPGTLPSFLVIGAQRSGSTFLHDTLTALTSARCSPLQKEVHYFDNKYYRSLDWYARFFDSTDGRKEEKTFETSPGYLYHPAAPKRVARSLPEVRVVAVLRDPVERALSQYRWMCQVGLETRGAVEAFCYDARRVQRERDPDYLRRFEDPLYFDFDHFQRGYLRRSLYHLQLKRWLRHVPSSRVRVVSSSDLFDRPREVVRILASFLGVRFRESRQIESANRNPSRSGVSVPREARAIAEKHLEEVPEEVEKVVEDEMLIGGRPLLR